ncbi:hypothetical protein RUND412_009465 [Rhizina undulata]
MRRTGSNSVFSLACNSTRKSQQITLDLPPPAAAVAKPFDTLITAPTTYFLHTDSQPRDLETVITRDLMWGLSRKAFPQSNTPATPMIVPKTPMGPIPTAGFPSGRHLFDDKFYSPSTPGKGDTLALAAPAPLERCPPEPVSKPFWLMKRLCQVRRCF